MQTGRARRICCACSKGQLHAEGAWDGVCTLSNWPPAPQDAYAQQCRCHARCGMFTYACPFARCCRYRLRQKFDIEDVSDRYSVWVQFGGSGAPAEPAGAVDRGLGHKLRDRRKHQRRVQPGAAFSAGFGRQC